VIDGVDGAILDYDNANRLTTSLSSASFTDQYGYQVVRGLTSYSFGAAEVELQINAAQISFTLTDQTVGNNGSLFVVNPHAAVAIAASVSLIAPSNNAVPDQAFITVSGLSADGVTTPLVHVGKLLPGDVTVLIDGMLKYAVAGVAEVWHAILPQANWAAVGAPWGDPKYLKTATGTVRFSGAISWTDGVTAAPVSIFTLPVGYRPNRRVRMPVIVMTGDGVTPQVEGLTVQGPADPTPGLVQLTNYPAGGPNTPITLEGLEFDLVT